MCVNANYKKRTKMREICQKGYSEIRGTRHQINQTVVRKLIFRRSEVTFYLYRD